MRSSTAMPVQVSSNTTCCAVLTDAGVAAVVAAGPGHVATVRRLIIEALDSTQLQQLHAAHQEILSRLDPDRPAPEWLGD
jgi:hypothetical protein